MWAWVLGLGVIVLGPMVLLTTVVTHDIIGLVVTCRPAQGSEQPITSINIAIIPASTTMVLIAATIAQAIMVGGEDLPLPSASLT
jgi:hypothetical protein